MKPAVLLSVISLALFALPDPPIHADPGFYGGNACLEYTSATSGLYRSLTPDISIYHASTSASKTLQCPVYIDEATADPGAPILYFSDTSSVDDVACTPHFYDDDGYAATFGTRYSCGFAGGCTSPTVSWQGGGSNLYWSDIISGTLSGNLAAGFTCNLGVVDSAEIMKIEHYEWSY